MPTIYTEVEVDVTLDDFDTEDLVDELERRGHGLETDSDTDAKTVLETIYVKRRLGQDYQQELDQLIWMSLGRIC